MTQAAPLSATARDPAPAIFAPRGGLLPRLVDWILRHPRMFRKFLTVARNFPSSSS